MLTLLRECGVSIVYMREGAILSGIIHDSVTPVRHHQLNKIKKINGSI